MFDDWFLEGLKEVGLTEKEYLALSKPDKKNLDEALKEMGHME